MGERGLTNLVEEWVTSEPDPMLRDRLRREASEGYVDWLQRSRPSDHNTNLMPDIYPRSEFPGMLPPVEDVPPAPPTRSPE